MADVTNLFKAQVKALKLRNKSLPDQNNKNSDDSASRILGKKHESDFEVKAKKLVNSITKLRDFLLDNRKNYVNSGSLLSSHGNEMSDVERDQVDSEAQEIIKSCRSMIGVFRTETNGLKMLPQVKEHRQAAMVLVEAYLKAICKIYTEQKAVRVKRIVDKKKISRLEPERKIPSLTLSNYTKKVKPEETDAKSALSEKDQEPKKTGSTNNRVPLFEETDVSVYSTQGESLSAEEIQMFEQENAALYQEMNSMSEEVKKVEVQVVEIAKLQEVFTEKILEQDAQIDQIATTVIGTTENIIDGNEEIRKAMRKKSEFRVMLLFFLLVCTLSLLFLDWYNV